MNKLEIFHANQTFCRGSPNNYFCQIICNSDHWFKRRCLKSLTWVHKGNWPRPLLAMFLTDHIRFRFFL